MKAANVPADELSNKESAFSGDCTCDVLKHPSSAIPISGYPLGPTHFGNELMGPIGRVTVARMATVKPQGWVYAALEVGCMSSLVRKWSELDNQIPILKIDLSVELQER